jgi:hypothetical protein
MCSTTLGGQSKNPLVNQALTREGVTQYSQPGVGAQFSAYPGNPDEVGFALKGQSKKQHAPQA